MIFDQYLALSWKSYKSRPQLLQNINSSTYADY